MSVATWLIAGLVGKNHYQPRPTTNSIIDMKQGFTMFCSYRLFITPKFSFLIIM